MGNIFNDSSACRVKKLADDLYCLEEVGNINIYLLVGEAAAMLIDTGYGYTDYRTLIRTITDLPIYVVNTHGDPDHALGSYLFDKVYMGQEDYEELLANCSPDFKLTTIRYRYSVMPEVKGLIDEKAYCSSNFNNTSFEFIKEGDTFDLGGNQTIEVYSVPGHSNGSLALLDRKNHRLFTGDIITYHNIWNFASVERCSFPKMLKTYRKAKALQPYYSEVFPAHGMTPVPPTVVDELIECIYDIRDNHDHDELLQNEFADSLTTAQKFRHPYKHVIIIYSEDNLRDMLENGLDD